jgi:hypothetical protein
VPQIEDWNGRSIAVENTKADGSGVWLVFDYSDNLIRTGIELWPPAAITQKLYRSDRTNQAPVEVQKAVKRKLGFYCDLQSLHSEDAITWSFFGPLARATSDARARFLNWLCDRLGLPWTNNRSCEVDLWRRVVHPKTLVSGGPELDFFLVGDQCLIVGEAKWFSTEGRHGTGKEDTQMHYRRRFLTEFAPEIYGERGRALVGVALDRGIESELPGPTPGVETKPLYWADLCEYTDHPAGQEFSAYYDWKQEYMAESYKRAGRGRSR